MNKMNKFAHKSPLENFSPTLSNKTLTYGIDFTLKLIYCKLQISKHHTNTFHKWYPSCSNNSEPCILQVDLQLRRINCIKQRINTKQLRCKIAKLILMKPSLNIYHIVSALFQHKYAKNSFPYKLSSPNLIDEGTHQT